MAPALAARRRPWTSRTCSGPHWSGLLLWDQGLEEGGRAPSARGLEKPRLPLSLAESWDFLVLLRCY